MKALRWLHRSASSSDAAYWLLCFIVLLWLIGK